MVTHNLLHSQLTTQQTHGTTVAHHQAPPSSGRDFRARALDPSRPLPIWDSRELIQQVDFQQQNTCRSISHQQKTGVDKEDESEFHLQEILSRKAQFLEESATVANHNHNHQNGHLDFSQSHSLNRNERNQLNLKSNLGHIPIPEIKINPKNASKTSRKRKHYKIPTRFYKYNQLNTVFYDSPPKYCVDSNDKQFLSANFESNYFDRNNNSKTIDFTEENIEIFERVIDLFDEISSPFSSSGQLTLSAITFNLLTLNDALLAIENEPSLKRYKANFEYLVREDDLKSKEELEKERNDREREREKAKRAERAAQRQKRSSGENNQESEKVDSNINNNSSNKNLEKPSKNEELINQNKKDPNIIQQDILSEEGIKILVSYYNQKRQALDSLGTYSLNPKLVHLDIADENCTALKDQEDIFEQFKASHINQNQTQLKAAYICYRRRHDKRVRTRKNHKTDEYNFEKFVRLRMEIESLKELIKMVNCRERLKKSYLENSLDVFIFGVVICVI